MNLVGTIKFQETPQSLFVKHSKLKAKSLDRETNFVRKYQALNDLV